MTEPNISDMRSTGYGDRALLMEQAGALLGAEQPFIGPDEVPNLSDPSSRPDEPVTTGLGVGEGDGAEILGNPGPDPVRQTLQAMLLASPNNDVMRMIDFLDAMGR